MLLIEKFGSPRVDLLISTASDGTDTVANRLLTREGVYVGKSIGEHTIDLRAEIIIKDNAEFLNVLEDVKGMDGVKDTVWSEIEGLIQSYRLFFTLVYLKNM